ncbi:ECF sigma factor [Stieleria neptunia]|uniref:ECF sigma factor n=1 Tax=Stieleria neptunia TaxID=2527979 RepID=A0A518HYP9_9BACT|nr:ECF-type sigma factor [Stieleria neptunia]QDV45962.1 ECF sigma factor [Stieleria neptunia]
MNECSEEGSVTKYIGRLKEGESFAEHELWFRYTKRLVGLARDRLGVDQPGFTEPEDVASLAYYDLLKGIQDERFQRLDDRGDLWQVLAMLTVRRSIDEKRRRTAIKRGPEAKAGPDEMVDEAANNADSPVDRVGDLQPTPEQAMIFKEEFRRRLDQLDDVRLKEIALARMAGSRNEEIASRLGCSLRSVERKLALIRRRWLEAESPRSSSQS